MEQIVPVPGMRFEAQAAHVKIRQRRKQILQRNPDIEQMGPAVEKSGLAHEHIGQIKR